VAGAHGLEQAIVATSDHAPIAISVAVRRLSAQIQYGKLSDGLRRFADEVDHPIAHFVSAALITATKYQARDIAQLLGHLAQCAREEGRMRTRIWVGRARTRSSVPTLFTPAQTGSTAARSSDDTPFADLPSWLIAAHHTSKVRSPS
jgi:Flp pilus assembly protein TadB